MPFVKGKSGNTLYKDEDGKYPQNFFIRGTWQYQEGRPLCKMCGLLARYHTKNKDGSVKYWRKYCSACHKNNSRKKIYGYRLFKKKYCEKCFFIAIHPAQLTVDHIDGNHDNNEINNLQTLCANCHALKTVISGDHNGMKYIPTLPHNRQKQTTIYG